MRGADPVQPPQHPINSNVDFLVELNGDRFLVFLGFLAFPRRNVNALKRFDLTRFVIGSKRFGKRYRLNFDWVHWRPYRCSKREN